MIRATVRAAWSSSRSLLHGTALRLRYGRRLTIGKGVTFAHGARVRLAGEATLSIGDGVTLTHTTIVATGRSRVAIGQRCAIAGTSLSVSGSGRVQVGPGCRFNSLEPGARTTFVVRDGETEIGASVFIDGGFYRVLDGGQLRIGDHASFGVESEVRAELSVTIGAYTMVSYRVSIFDTNTHSLDHRDRRREVDRYPAYERGEVHRAAVRIGDDCWIGLGSAVLKGADIGDRTIVGLHTTVTAGLYPPDSRLVGHPARAVGVSPGD